MIFYYNYEKKNYPWELASLCQKYRKELGIPFITYSKRYKKFYAYSVYTKKHKIFIDNPKEEKIKTYLKEYYENNIYGNL